MYDTKVLAPSILNADFACLRDQVRQVEAGGADWLHLDIMDGHFVPNLTFGPMLVEAVRKFTALPLDCHLMVERPEDYVAAFAQAGATSLTIHQEATRHLDSLLAKIRSLGCKAGVSVNPATPVEALELVLPQTDLVLVMSVNPGFGGQKFIPYALAKLRALRARIDALGLATRLQVDGGIGPGNVRDVIAAGADAVVCGSAIFASGNIAATTAEMKRLMAGDVSAR